MSQIRCSCGMTCRGGSASCGASCHDGGEGEADAHACRDCGTYTCGPCTLDAGLCLSCLMERDGLVLAKVDSENGCEACWEAARADGTVDHPHRHDLALAPPDWVGRQCPHGASESAPSVLRAASDE